MEIDRIIKKRKTQKILAPEPWSTEGSADELKVLLDELLDLAAHAPYHYRAHQQYTDQEELNSTLPYRFYVLDRDKCRATSRFYDRSGIDGGKIKNMLDAAEALFIVTWLPEPSEINSDGGKQEVAFEGNIRNMEHISAASAAIQNVLLGATARNIPNYWSTGGTLRGPALKYHLHIPANEIIAGTIFLFPEDAESREARIVPGGLREVGKEQSSWAKWVE